MLPLGETPLTLPTPPRRDPYAQRADSAWREALSRSFRGSYTSTHATLAARAGCSSP